MKNKIIILILIINAAFSQGSLPGLNGFFGAKSVALAGVSGTTKDIEGEQINPANIIFNSPQVGVSIIKYPADIYAQRVSHANTFKNINYNVSLQRINYGTFNKLNAEGNGEGYYSAGDTWLNIDVAKKKNNLIYGTGGGLFLSNIDSYNASAAVFSAGVIYDIDKPDLRLGLSLTNVGFFLTQYTDHNDRLPTRLTFSIGKPLKYLPLELNTDIGYGAQNNNVSIRVGGIFQLPYNFNMLLGISSDNLEQATEYQNIKSLLGGTGIGFSYSGSKYELTVGGYSYGPGGWTYGTTFSYRLKHPVN